MELSVLKEIQEGSRIDQGEMGTEGWEAEGHPRLLLSAGTDAVLGYDTDKLFSLYPAVKMINYITYVFIFPLL